MHLLQHANPLAMQRLGASMHSRMATRGWQHAWIGKAASGNCSNEKMSVEDMPQLFREQLREQVKSSLPWLFFPPFGLSNKLETRGMIDGDALSVFGHLGDAAVDSWEQ